MDQERLSPQVARASPGEKHFLLIVEGCKSHPMLIGKLIEEACHCAHEKRPLVLRTGATVEKQQNVVGALSGLEALYLAWLTVLQYREVFTGQVGDWLPGGIIHQDVYRNRLDVNLDLKGVLSPREREKVKTKQEKDKDSGCGFSE